MCSRFNLMRGGACRRAFTGAGTDHRLLSAAKRLATAKRFPAAAERRAKCRATNRHLGADRQSAERLGGAECYADVHQLPAAADGLAERNGTDPRLTANQPAAEPGAQPDGPRAAKHL